MEKRELLSFEGFLHCAAKLEITAGLIFEVHEIPKSKKLLHLKVDFGNGDVRDVVTNIKEQLADPMDLEGQITLFFTNLEPVVIMGVNSEAMIMPGVLDGKLVFGNYKFGTKLL